MVASTADWIIITSTLPSLVPPSPSPCVEVTVCVGTFILRGTVTTSRVILGVKFLLQNEIFLSVFLPDGGQGVHIIFKLSSSILLLLGVGEPPLETLHKIMIGNSPSVSEHQLSHGLQAELGRVVRHDGVLSLHRSLLMSVVTCNNTVVFLHYFNDFSHLTLARLCT